MRRTASDAAGLLRLTNPGTLRRWQELAGPLYTSVRMDQNIMKSPRWSKLPEQPARCIRHAPRSSSTCDGGVSAGWKWRTAHRNVSTSPCGVRWMSSEIWSRPKCKAALPKVDDGAFVPGFFLVADWVEDSHSHRPPHHASLKDVNADRPTCYILHGILGTGKNWVPFVRTLAESFPHWQFLLLDLRGHGDSRDLPGMHNLHSTAMDVEMLARATGRAPDIVIGHSFGGKVAMEYMHLASVTPEMTWILDSWLERMQLNSMFRHDNVHWHHDYEKPSTMTEVQPGASSNIMQTLESIPMPVTSRSAVSEKLIAEGYAKETATWMVSNLVRVQGAKQKGLVWRFNLGVAKALITSAASTDSLPLLLNAKGQVGFVRAGKGLRWTPDALHRLDQVLQLPNVDGHCIRDSGHWLHVEAPLELTRILAPSFRSIDSGLSRDL